jgi:hypothetical protein
MPVTLLNIYLRIRGFSWGFETIYVSALRPNPINVGGPKVCFFFFRFLTANVPDVDGPLSICATVGIAWWIMRHTNPAAITRRCMVQYIGSVFKFINTLIRLLFTVSGPGSSVGIATGYGLDGPGIESRRGARIFAHIQNGPEAHPAFCTMRTGSFPGVKRPGRDADHPPPSRAEVKKE